MKGGFCNDELWRNKKNCYVRSRKRDVETTKKRSFVNFWWINSIICVECLKIVVRNFDVFLGVKKGNCKLTLEMCSDEFSLKHAPALHVCARAGVHLCVSVSVCVSVCVCMRVCVCVCVGQWCCSLAALGFRELLILWMMVSCGSWQLS